jgi:hypothetical protein
VMAAALPYVAPDFESLIQDVGSFDPVSSARRLAQRQEILLPSLPPSSFEIEAWTTQSNPLVVALSSKLKKRIGSGDPVDLEAAVNEAVGWFLERDNALEALRKAAPQLHEVVIGIISRQVSILQMAGPYPDGTPHAILRSEVENLKRQLKEGVANFSDATAHQMALGTVAEWLMRCPLDFPPYHHAT